MTDLFLDTDLDLFIKNGDLAIGESTLQHEKLILLTEKGHWREYPFVGVGLQQYLLDDDLSPLPEEIQKQDELDGLTVYRLDVYDNGEIKTYVLYDNTLQDQAYSVRLQSSGIVGTPAPDPDPEPLGLPIGQAVIGVSNTIG